MTPKEEYEARKAERKAKREQSSGYGKHDPDEVTIELLDQVDRFVTAFERIADATEAMSKWFLDDDPKKEEPKA